MNNSDSTAGTTGSAKLATTSAWLLAIGIILIASNLRAPITSIGPIISNISESTGMSSSVAGLLTTLPLIAFGLVSPLAPIIAKRIKMENTLLLSMLVLVAAIIIRSMNSMFALFIGTFVIGVAIAIANVLLPSLIKRDFPSAVGLMMGFMSVMLNLGAALGSGLSVPLIEQVGLSWRGVLAIWAILAVLAALIWIPIVFRKNAQAKKLMKASIASKIDESSNVSGGRGMWKLLLAWQVTIFMGLQSFTFYVNVSWLPEILQDRGMSATDAGYLVSLLQLVGIPLSFIAPILAVKLKNQRVLALATAALMFVGYAGLLVSGSTWLPLWAILVGLGGGAGFSLAITFFVLRTSTAELSAELSGMAQSFGYLLAAAGPLLFGVFYDLTGGWTVGLIMMIVVVILYVFAGWGAASNKVIRPGDLK